ncbi:phage distal tail protein [Amycolatopsis japonica]
MPTRVIWPTYTVGAWAANVDDDLECRWVVDTQTLNDGVARKTHVFERPFGMGAFRDRSYLAARTGVIQGWCQAPDRAGRVAARDRLMALFPDGGQALLVVDDGIAPRQLLVELDADVPKCAVWKTGEGFDWQLQLLANDPRFLDTTVRSASTTIGTVAFDGLDWAAGSPGGLDWAAGSPGGLDWGSSGSGGLLTMANPGSAITWPIFTVTTLTSLANVIFTDPVNGDVLTYGGTIEAGQTLTIDCSPFTRSVTLNGIDRSSSLSSAQWIELPAGQTTTVQVAGTGAGTVTANWQYAYN